MQPCQGALADGGEASGEAGGPTWATRTRATTTTTLLTGGDMAASVGHGEDVDGQGAPLYIGGQGRECGVGATAAPVTIAPLIV